MSKHFGWWRRLFVTAVAVGGLMASQSFATFPPPPPPPGDPVVDEPTGPTLPPAVEESLTLGGDASKVISELTNGSPVIVIQRLPGLNPLSGMIHRHDRTGGTPSAGELTDLRLDGDYTGAAFTDNVLGGTGIQTAMGATLTGMFRERYLVGIGVNQNNYRLYGPLDLMIHTQSLTLFTLYQVTQDFSFGGFLDYSQTDIEDSLVNVGGTTVNLADQFDRYGGGFIASYVQTFGEWDWGITSTIASMNKKSPHKLWDNEDTTWATMVETSHPITERLLFSLHTTYLQALDNETAADGSFWYLGSDLFYNVSDKMTVGMGLEKPLAYENYDEEFRLNMTLTYLF
jgi:hypothetical protein